ncbi:MAG: HAD-IA family hydrolase [Xanthomonadales bacterium]|nr:HAD-IA family hydrolase [Xanthomonadales bacterium]
MIKAVLFDLDGTLLDSAPDLVATLNYLRSSVKLKPLPVDHLRHFVSRGAAGLINAGMPPCDDETRAEWRALFLQHYEQNSYVHSAPFEGVEEVLSELDKRGIPWGIVTNKMEYLCFPILEKTGWKSAATTVVCGDTVGNIKPHPDPVLAACREIGVRPQEALMVGDDLRDMEAGRRAGTSTAFALYGYADGNSHLDIIGNATLLHTPQDVLALLQSPNQNVLGA